MCLNKKTRQRTAAACSLSYRPVSSHVSTANARTTGIGVLNSTSADDWKIKSKIKRVYDLILTSNLIYTGMLMLGGSKAGPSEKLQYSVKIIQYRCEEAIKQQLWPSPLPHFWLSTSALKANSNVTLPHFHVTEQVRFCGGHAFVQL